MDDDRYPSESNNVREAENASSIRQINASERVLSNLLLSCLRNDRDSRLNLLTSTLGITLSRSLDHIRNRGDHIK